MKKTLILILSSLIIIGCISTKNYPMTEFIVKNTTEKPISFSASVIKMSQTFGAQEITNSFVVKPHDSIVARQTYFKKDTENPQKWFSRFEISPVVEIEMNNPEKAENWIKGEKDKVPTYTFLLNKSK
jgi:hypothetical protein